MVNGETKISLASELITGNRDEEGIQVKYPYMIQAYDVSGMNCVGEILRVLCTTTFHVEGHHSDGGILGTPETMRGLALLRNPEGQPTPLDVRTMREVMVPRIQTLYHPLMISGCCIPRIF